MSGKPTGRYVDAVAGDETVRAFVPDPLPPSLSKAESNRLAEPLRRADAALDRLRLAGQMIPSIDWFVYSFVRKEALLSSEIEGTQATLTDVLSYERIGRAGDSNVEDVEEVTNYIRAANYAFQELEAPNGLPVSVRLLNACHQILMQGVRGENKQPGELRRSQVWVGGTRPGNAQFVPPPSNLVPDLLTDLETAIHSESDLHPLLRIGAAHVQFETIHPYLDGNGRLGRMLMALLLQHWALLQSPLLYLSLYLKRNQRAYYALLDRVRSEGAWVDWFEFFLEGVANVADDAVGTAGSLHRRVTDDRVALLESGVATVSAIQLFELLPANPVITMPMATDLLETTKPTATKAIEALKASGILRQVGSQKRDRLYVYTAYINVLQR